MCLAKGSISSAHYQISAQNMDDSSDNQVPLDDIQLSFPVADTPPSGPYGVPPTGSSSSRTNLEKIKLIQKQLVLLIHAVKCQRLDSQANQVARQCLVPHCHTLKNVLTHMKTCQGGETCPIPHCLSATKIISHWKKCKRSNCVVCLPVKQQQATMQQGETNQGPSVAELQRLPLVFDMDYRVPSIMQMQQVISRCQTMNANDVQLSQSSAQVANDWRQLLTLDDRERFVQRIAQTILPNPVLSALQNDRMIITIAHARKVEGDIYSTAKDKAEYYQCLADKLFALQKEYLRRGAVNGNQGSAVTNDDQHNTVANHDKLNNVANDGQLYVVTNDGVSPVEIDDEIESLFTSLNLEDYCNNCEKRVENRFHCTTCDDFNLCHDCYKMKGHHHEMEKLVSDSGDESMNVDHPTTNATTSSISRCSQSLIHAFRCQSVNCKLPNCLKMKRVVQHVKSCKRKSSGSCPICKQFLALCCYHAKECKEVKCLMPYCPHVKSKLQQRQVQKSLEEVQKSKNHLSNMSCGGIPSGSISGTLSELLRVLKSPKTPQQQQQVLNILKLNPQLMAAFIKHRMMESQAIQQQPQLLQWLGPQQLGQQQMKSQHLENQQPGPSQQLEPQQNTFVENLQQAPFYDHPLVQEATANCTLQGMARAGGFQNLNSLRQAEILMRRLSIRGKPASLRLLLKYR